MKKKIVVPVLVLLLLLVIVSCGNSYDGKYMFKNDRWHIEIELSDDVMIMRDIVDKGKTGVEFKANYHITDENVIILDKMLKGPDSLEFQTGWNTVKVKINDDGIEFYEDFDREDDLMFFTKIK